MKRARPGCIAAIAALNLLSFATASTTAQEPVRTPVLFDADLGSDMDDPLALALLLASPELELRGVTTAGGDPQVRALLACRFLTMTGRRSTPVAAGAAPQPDRPISPTGHYRYYYHPDVLFNRTTRPQAQSAVDFLHARFKAQPAKVTLLAAGPLTNVARLVADKPECKEWIRQVVVVARPEDMRADIEAARAVLQSGVPLIVLTAEQTAQLVLDDNALRRVFAPATALSLNLQALHQLWDGDAPTLATALGVTFCLDERFCKLEPARLDVNEQGEMRSAAGAPNVQLVSSIDAARFTKWYVERLEDCVSPASRPVQLIIDRAMPHRVHVAEDYDTDIERFWWMSGIAETANLPPDSRRACRGSLTHDFDDLLGNAKAMHTAVVFNPVPGPPMGKRSRLRFRFWLKGTDTLRVQIYSLTNGYHRQLVVQDLPQGRWEEGIVDMTLARRPDGTGGPLSEGERIDDIQFYTDPTAELLIDDVVLYDAAPQRAAPQDAAPPDADRAFPRHVHFAAPFDTGQQGKHWPGDFEIVAEQGYFWRAAKSVGNADLAAPWIRLGLRGPRTMGAATQISFRYRLSGADNLRVRLLGPESKVDCTATLERLQQEEWSRATVDFRTAAGERPQAGSLVEEAQFLLPKGAELLLDDFLLFDPQR